MPATSAAGGGRQQLAGAAADVEHAHAGLDPGQDQRPHRVGEPPP
jgi:hypothetical protein